MENEEDKDSNKKLFKKVEVTDSSEGDPDVNEMQQKKKINTDPIKDKHSPGNKNARKRYRSKETINRSLNTVCEYPGCKKPSSSGSLIKSKTTKHRLCTACTQYETLYKKLIPRAQRLSGHPNLERRANKDITDTSPMPVCEYPGCKRPSKLLNGYLAKSTTTDYRLCGACMQYERLYDKLIPRVQRQKGGRLESKKNADKNQVYKPGDQVSCKFRVIGDDGHGKYFPAVLRMFDRRTQTWIVEWQDGDHRDRNDHPVGDILDSEESEKEDSISKKEEEEKNEKETEKSRS